MCLLGRMGSGSESHAAPGSRHTCLLKSRITNQPRVMMAVSSTNRYDMKRFVAMLANRFMSYQQLQCLYSQDKVHVGTGCDLSGATFAEDWGGLGGWAIVLGGEEAPAQAVPEACGCCCAAGHLSRACLCSLTVSQQSSARLTKYCAFHCSHLNIGFSFQLPSSQPVLSSAV